MKKCLLPVAVILLAVGWATDRKWGWTNAGRSSERTVPVSATNVRTITVHLPDPNDPTKTQLHILKVFRIGTDAGEVDVAEWRSGNWNISTFPSDPPTGKGRVTYYASP